VRECSEVKVKVGVMEARVMASVAAAEGGEGKGGGGGGFSPGWRRCGRHSQHEEVGGSCSSGCRSDSWPIDMRFFKIHPQRPLCDSVDQG